MLRWKVSKLDECDAMPPSPFGVSFYLGSWDSVVRLSRNDEQLLGKLKYGYPRVFIHSYLRQVSRFGLEGLGCYVFHSHKIAMNCQKHIKYKGRVEKFEFGDISAYGIYFPIRLEKEVHAFFQVSGENISPRMALDCLAKLDVLHTEDTFCFNEGQYQFYFEPEFNLQEIRDYESKAKKKLRRCIADFIQEDYDDVFLFPTGMSAIYNGMRLVNQRLIVCLGLPYRDTYRMFTLLGPACRLVKSLKELELLALETSIAMVFCEFPSNPLLISPNLKKLQKLADNYGFKVMLDITLANFINLTNFAIADIIVISLTKAFSGQSDVMGGCLILNKASQYHPLLKARQNSIYEDTLYCRDALILLRNSRDLEQRAQTMNSNALNLAYLLSKSPYVKRVNYPKFITPELYQAFMANGGGYGGVMSLEFHRPPDAIIFYNALNLPKGMSIGANFTLVAPFTVLAYPDDVEFATNNGIDPYLVRISVGIEAYPSLESAFTQAINAISTFYAK